MNLLAVAGIQPELPQASNQQQWETLTDIKGDRYRQISFLLHSQQGENWGYLQVGRSLQDVDRYVANVRRVLLIELTSQIKATQPIEVFGDRHECYYAPLLIVIKMFKFKLKMNWEKLGKKYS